MTVRTAEDAREAMRGQMKRGRKIPEACGSTFEMKNVVYSASHKRGAPSKRDVFYARCLTVATRLES